MFVLENKELKFERVTTEDFLKCKNLLTVVADSKANLNDKMAANEMLDKIAFKYLRVKNSKGEWQKNITFEVFDTLFEGQGGALEVSAEFQKLIASFLENLPSFRSQMA